MSLCEGADAALVINADINEMWPVMRYDPFNSLSSGRDFGIDNVRVCSELAVRFIANCKMSKVLFNDEPYCEAPSVAAGAITVVHGGFGARSQQLMEFLGWGFFICSRGFGHRSWP